MGGETGRSRIVVLTYESLQSNTATDAVVSEFASDVTAIVALHQPPSIRQHLDALKKSPVFFVWKATEIVLYRLSTLLGSRLSRVSNLPTLARTAGADYVVINSIKDEGSINMIEQYEPDVIVSIHFPELIGRRVREAARFGAINTHGSYLPFNRGLFPYFWTMAKRDGNGGVTVHELAAGYDTGAIVVQEPLEPGEGETVFQYSVRSAQLAGRLLVETIAALLDGTAVAVPQDPGAANYVSWPSIADVCELRRKGGRLGSPLRVFNWRRSEQSG